MASIINCRFRNFERLNIGEKYLIYTYLKTPKATNKVRLFGLTLRAEPISDLGKANKWVYEDLVEARQLINHANKIKLLRLIFRWNTLKLPLWFWGMMRVVSVFKCHRHCVKEFHRLEEIEKAWIPRTVKKADNKDIGLERLNPVSMYMPVREIAARYSRSPSEIWKWKYIDIFVEMSTESIVIDIKKAKDDKMRAQFERNKKSRNHGKTLLQ